MIKDENYRKQPVNPADKYTAAVVLAIVLMVCAGLLGGCRPINPERPRQDNTILNLYSDPETGCQYLGQYSGNAGITARIAADGKTHMGCKAAN